MKTIIEVDNLSFSYSADRPVLKDISFSVETGEFLAVAGPNGVGKSTLLALLCGSLPPRSGTITLDSAPIQTYDTSALARKVALVRQEFIPVFGFSVLETVALARIPYYSALGFVRQTDARLIRQALDATDVIGLAERTLASLSAGERQRVFIARALAQNADVLLLDEPTSFLDFKHQVAIYDLLKTTQLEKSKTVVAVTHDINLAAQYCDQVLLLGPDFTFKHGSTNDVFRPEQIEQTYGVRVHAGQIGREKFFIPLGRLAKDNHPTNWADPCT